METVFIVEAGVDYEGSRPVRAFATSYEASEFARECNAHLEKRPKFPKGEVSEDDIRAWSDAEKAWEAAHEAGQQGSPDWFRCVEVPFGQATHEAEALGDKGRSEA